MEAHHRLKKKLEQYLGKIGAHPVLLERSLYLGKNIPIGGTAHQAGTCRFGTDPGSSVLDLNCKAHGLDNLYVTDASFFPSIGAVNPTLTIIANALRVADHLRERLGSMTFPILVVIVERYLLVALFFPFSALDKSHQLQGRCWPGATSRPLQKCHRHHPHSHRPRRRDHHAARHPVRCRRTGSRRSSWPAIAA